MYYYTLGINLAMVLPFYYIFVQSLFYSVKLSNKTKKKHKLSLRTEDLKMKLKMKAESLDIFKASVTR
jgi:hypothetical protein